MDLFPSFLFILKAAVKKLKLAILLGVLMVSWPILIVVKDIVKRVKSKRRE